MKESIKITIGHSSDPDDAFMFYKLARDGSAETEKSIYHFNFFTEDITTLNQWGEQQRLDITALSLHAYFDLTEKYQLFSHGASFGNNYGPLLITSNENSDPEWWKTPVAIPGEKTTAFLTLQLLSKRNFPFEVLPFREIIPAVKRGEFKNGLIIHEGQLTWKKEGLRKIHDLGEWWHKEESLPLPLGINSIRRDLPERIKRELSDILLDSIKYSLTNSEEAIKFARKFAPGLDTETTHSFVNLYVNDLTLSYGDTGKKALETYYKRAVRVNLIPEKHFGIDFVS